MFFFFFNDTATTEIYTLSLHDALPISTGEQVEVGAKTEGLLGGRLTGTLSLFRINRKDVLDTFACPLGTCSQQVGTERSDRKSTRLNSSHGYISYAVFCLKKKKQPRNPQHPSRPPTPTTTSSTTPPANSTHSLNSPPSSPCTIYTLSQLQFNVAHTCSYPI